VVIKLKTPTSSYLLMTTSTGTNIECVVYGALAMVTSPIVIGFLSLLAIANFEEALLFTGLTISTGVLAVSAISIYFIFRSDDCDEEGVHELTPPETQENSPEVSPYISPDVSSETEEIARLVGESATPAMDDTTPHDTTPHDVTPQDITPHDIAVRDESGNIRRLSEIEEFSGKKRNLKYIALHTAGKCCGEIDDAVLYSMIMDTKSTVYNILNTAYDGLVLPGYPMSSAIPAVTTSVSKMLNLAASIASHYDGECHADTIHICERVLADQLVGETYRTVGHIRRHSD